MLAEDHVHPSDSSQAPLASPVLRAIRRRQRLLQGTTIPASPTTAFVSAAVAAGGGGGSVPATVPPLMDGVAAVGVATKYAREDHVHPGDTARAPLASPTFTGTPAAPTASVGTNTTQIATTAFVSAAVTTALAGGAAPTSPSGRLTLTPSTPVMIAAVATGTTVYWTPYRGAQMPLYNGTIWTVQAINQISVVTTDVTKNPAAIGANKINDWFIWNDAGTVRISHGPDWTSDTLAFCGDGIGDAGRYLAQ